MNQDTIIKIGIFAALVEEQQLASLKARGLTCQANIDNCKTKTKIGKRYTKVDVGSSGKFMVENETGNIYGIKGYGVVHTGHFYGTLDTTAEYNWGNYYPEKIAGPTPAVQSNRGLTFATEAERAKYYGQTPAV